MEDTGRYQCEVATEEGIFNSREALLTVFDNLKKEVFDVLDDEVILGEREENNALEAIDKEGFIEIEMVSNVPEIVDSYLINPKTGFVKWTSPTPPDGFILLIHANNTPLTNLTMDGMARQVKLTPLSPNITYSVRIASVIRGKVTFHHLCN